jgi:hypothetical protein
MASAPIIDLQSAPADEHTQMMLLNKALRDIDRFIADFSAALDLFDYCDSQRSGAPNDKFFRWRYIAARDAVMTVFHFRYSMEAAGNFAKGSSYLKPNLDRAKLSKATAAFDKRFPDYELSRHAVAHAGEIGKSVPRFNRNSFSGTFQGEAFGLEDVSNVVVGDQLDGRAYTSTFEGKVVRCEVSKETLGRLADISSTFYSAFNSK